MNKSFKIVVIAVLVVAIVSMSFKVIPFTKSLDRFMPSEVYEVDYNFFMKGGDKEMFIKTYVPQDNERQKILRKDTVADKVNFKIENEKENKRAIWKLRKGSNINNITYSFTFKGKAIQYNIADNLPITKSFSSQFLNEEKYIEVHHSKIDSLAKSLALGKTNLKSVLTSLYNFVYHIPSAPIRDVTSAVTAFEQNQASCNGKARLFVALCRNRGIPAKLKGGLILENTKKRISHLWAEVLVNDKWIPFDVLNGHFAYLPSNYLEIYSGDHFLITHTPNVLFDYSYEIKNISFVPFINVTAKKSIINHPVSLVKLLQSKIMPKSVLNFLILLPLGGLLIALIKNVIGLKTYGVFLPILIAFALTYTGYFTGVFLFMLITLLVTVISIPLNNWGLLYAPKMVVILSCTVVSMLIAILVGIQYKITWLTSFSFFPVIIVSIMAERFARAIEEDGYQKAINTILQTLLTTTLCYVVFSSVVIHSMLLIFPELLLIMIAMSLMLGKWIGLRVFEYSRFSTIL